MADSHAAAMIKRFREGKPMSRAEREKEKNSISEMWWIDKNDTNFTKTSDSDLPRRNSPIKPMSKNDLWDPINSPVPARRNGAWKNPISPPKRRTQRVDDLIADEIEDDFISKPTFGLDSPYSRPKPGYSYDRPLDLLGSLRLSRDERLKPSEEKSYRFRTSIKFDDDLDFRRSLEKNRQLTDSVDTLGTMGFKSLLAPNLRLDGKSEAAPPPKPEGTLELAHLTSNLETLLRSFKIDKPEIHLTEHDVPQSISQVTNQLNSDMLTFISHYQTKYTEEEMRDKEQKERDSDMKKLGQQEAQAKMIMDTEYFNVFCEEMQSAALGSLSTDEKILKEIENNIQQRRILSRANRVRDEDGREEKEDGSMYRHNLYHRQWTYGPHPYYREMGLSELSSNLKLQRTETMFRLQQLDPRWQQRQPTPNIPPDEKYLDEDMPLTGIDVLSFPTVNHRSITTAARDTISCCLNATMTTLAIRLPGEEEVERQKTIEDEVNKKYEEETQKLHAELESVKKELHEKEQELMKKIEELTPASEVKSSIPPEISPPSTPKIELVNHVKEEELKKLEDLLGPEEKESELLKEVLKKKDIAEGEQLKMSQKRNVYFQSAQELEEAILNRGNYSRQSIPRYVYPAKISNPEIPKPSAPELPQERFPSPPSVSRLDSLPRYEREAYLQKMKNMRQKLMSS